MKLRMTFNYVIVVTKKYVLCDNVLTIDNILI
jgi:hypothetical protein